MVGVCLRVGDLDLYSHRALALHILAALYLGLAEVIGLVGDHPGVLVAVVIANDPSLRIY